MTVSGNSGSSLDRTRFYYQRCDRIMVGSGGDTYDPTCDLRAGHRDVCRSTAAIDQHRLGWICHGCGTTDVDQRYDNGEACGRCARSVSGSSR